MSTTRRTDILKLFSARRIAIPIIIGLAVAGYMLVSSLMEAKYVKAEGEKAVYEWVDENEDGEKEEVEYQKVEPGQGTYKKVTYKEILASINWTWQSTFWMFIALLMMALRDLAYMYRIRVLTDYRISWKKSFDVIMLWEFASAITPSVVGGSGVALYIVNKEGISVGRSTAVVMVTAFLDELFYIVMVPVLIAIVGMKEMFPKNVSTEMFGIDMGIEIIFYCGYIFILCLTSVILYSVFFNPRGFKALLLRIFKIRFLRKWRYNAIQTGDDIMTTSAELRDKPFSYWFKAIVSTFFSWTARYWVVNFLILAFTSVIPYDHLVIYARQLAMWVIMLISPTPGSSGVAEFAFSGFLTEFIPIGLAAALALLWRLASYYPYLFIGAVVLPRWLKRVYGEDKKK